MESGMPNQMPMEEVAGAAGFMAAMFGFLLIAILIGLAVSIVICLIITKCFQRIPREHRQMEPGMVWLLLIPCFNLVWNFFVWIRLANSYKSYFSAAGVTDVGDCGYTINLAYCIATVCCLVPCLNYLAAIVSLILLILRLIKANELKNRIPEAEQMPTP